jgi:hypothetical protein
MWCFNTSLEPHGGRIRQGGPGFTPLLATQLGTSTQLLSKLLSADLWGPPPSAVSIEKSDRSEYKIMVPRAGVEPARGCPQRFLSSNLTPFFPPKVTVELSGQARECGVISDGVPCVSGLRGQDPGTRESGSWALMRSGSIRLLLPPKTNGEARNRQESANQDRVAGNGIRAHIAECVVHRT